MEDNSIIFLVVFIALVGTLTLLATQNFKYTLPFYAVLWNLSLGLFVFFCNPKSKINSSYALIAVISVFWSLAIFLYNNTGSVFEALMWSKVAGALSAFLPVLFLYFFSVFPQEDKVPNKHQVASWVAVSVFFGVLSFSNLIVADVRRINGEIIFIPGSAFGVFIAYFICFMTYAFFQLIKKYFRETGLSKLQIRYVLLGFFLGTIFPVMTNLILPLSGYSLFAGYGPFFVVLTIAFISYAVTKQHLMDISVIISRTVAEILAILFHGAIYLGLVWLYRTHVSTSIDLLFLIWTVLYGILVGQTHLRIRLFLQTTSDKLFLRGKYDYYKELSDASSRVGEKLSLSHILGVLYETFRDVVEISKPQVFLPEYFTETEKSSNRYLIYSAETSLPGKLGPEIRMDSPLVKELIARRDPIHEAKELNAALVVPCLLEDRLIAIFALGHKLSEDPYTDEDLRLLKVLANQVAITLDHTCSYERIKADLEAAGRQIERSQRLASLGTLTAGVTHEIRNPLTVIRAETERLANEPRDLNYLTLYRDLLLKHIDRIAGIVQRMLILAKEKPQQHVEVNLNEVINSTLQLFTISRIMLKKEFQPVPVIKGDAEELQQVFVNLIQNAIEAMPEGGTLTLRTFAEGGRVVAEVSDTGKGIPEEIREKIFDPFYSSRHEGVGLGLSIVYRIVREHGGDIKVSSELGKGTTFKLSFPS